MTAEAHQTAEDAPEAPVTPDEGSGSIPVPDDAQEAAETVEPHQLSQTGTTDAETFPRDYVEKLRRENADWRQKAQRADELAKRLLEVTVQEAAGGVLADPADLLVFGSKDGLVDEDGWPDRDRVHHAAQELAQARPHLAQARRVRGDIGQGATGAPETVDLAGLLRAKAR